MPLRALSVAARLAPLGAAALLVAACGPRVPAAPRPAPRPAGATTPAPATVPATTPVDTRASAWSFGYAPGFVEYTVTSLGEVTTEGDTTGSWRDSLATRARLSFRVSPANAPLGVLVTVDSFLVSPRRGAPLESALRMPVVFQAVLDPSRARLTFPAEQPMTYQPCAGPEMTLLALARDLVPALPAQLQRGAKWTDTSSHALCRAGIPLTVATRSEWKVEGELAAGDARYVRVVRDTRSTVAGTGTGRRAGATIAGTSESNAVYLVDPTAGRVEQLVVESKAELTVRERPDAPEIRTRQTARQSAVRTGQ